MTTRQLSVAPMLYLFLFACDSARSPVETSDTFNGVYILNEGSFMSGNAEISFYDPATGSVTGNLYSSANPDRTLGDVANHFQAANDKLYIVVNNSKKVEVIAAGTNIWIATIATVGQPRQICVVSPTKAYLTNQDTTVSILDLASWTEVRRVRVGDSPEGVFAVSGKVFVLNGGFGTGSTISVLSMDSDSVISTIQTPDGPSYGVIGTNGKLYVVCTGFTDYSNPSNDTPGAVICIDPVSLSVEQTLPITGHPGKLAVDASNNLYVLGPGSFPQTPVWKIAAGINMTVVSMSLVSGSYYGIGVHKGREELYLSESGNFVSSGAVVMYTLGGAYIQTFQSGIGIAPNGFVFIP